MDKTHLDVPEAPADEGAPLRLNIDRSESTDGVQMVRLVASGDLDSIGASSLIEVWGDEALAPGMHVHLDLRQVGFCNAAGLRAIDRIMAGDRMHTLAVRLSVPPQLAWLIRLVGLEQRWSVQPDVFERHDGATGYRPHQLGATGSM